MVTRAPRTLTRAAHGRPAAPVRIVHLGVGNFFRAHQAWYTEHAPDSAEWGIAAFTGRSAAMAEVLGAQEGLYTLITRGAAGDDFEVISSLSAVHAADDHPALLGYFGSPQLAVVTLTVTEAGYRRGPDGGLDLADPAVAADLVALRTAPRAPVRTAPARIVAGLLARHDAGLGPLAILSCDNLAGNGEVLARVVHDLAVQVDPALVPWITANIGFGTSMVDRITPATTDADRAAVHAALGVFDAAPVPTEPFSEWVIQAEFPAGRPAWEDAGARIVADVTPFERRKLALLNGSHTLLAYAGSLLGHETVAEAIADPRCRAWVEQWWDEACTQLPLPADELQTYRRALIERYRNPKLRHALTQIAADGSLKLPVRILPTLRAELSAGRVPEGAARIVAAWVLHLRGLGAPVTDVNAAIVLPCAQGSLKNAVAAVLVHLGVAEQPGVAELVHRSAQQLQARRLSRAAPRQQVVAAR